MRVAQTGSELGRAVCDALGIDSRLVLGLDISMRPNDMATVTIVRGVSSGEGARLLEVLDSYSLQRKAPDAEAALAAIHVEIEAAAWQLRNDLALQFGALRAQYRAPWQFGLLRYYGDVVNSP